MASAVPLPDTDLRRREDLRLPGGSCCPVVGPDASILPVGHVTMVAGCGAEGMREGALSGSTLQVATSTEEDSCWTEGGGARGEAQGTVSGSVSQATDTGAASAGGPEEATTTIRFP